MRQENKFRQAAIVALILSLGACATPETKEEAPAPAPAPAPRAMPAPAPAPVEAPKAVEAPKPKKVSLKSKSMFEFNKAVLTDDGKAEIDANILSKIGTLNSTDFVSVVGHACRMGSHQYNQQLSEARADAVKAYLVMKGVNADIIDTLGAGKTQPVPGVSCSDSLPRERMIECLAPNRRVEVELKGMAPG